MPSTVAQLIESADCRHGGSVRWGTSVPERSGGIYLIATTNDPDENPRASGAQIDANAVELMLDRRQELTVDGSRPSTLDFERRLQAMWIPDETVLYIGKATSIRSRVGQYYDTSIGARSPHAGGWPLKLLTNIDSLAVHWATSSMPELAGQKALAAFVHSVSDGTRSRLVDPDHPYPFANLEGPGGRKQHGIRGSRQPAGTSPQTQPQPQPQKSKAALEPKKRLPLPRSGETERTQRVTPADLKAGRIRIPRGVKSLFPPERSDVKIRLRSRDLMVRWDPRFGPPERSGTLGIGKAILAALVEPNETLTIRRVGDQLGFE